MLGFEKGEIEKACHYVNVGERERDRWIDSNWQSKEIDSFS